MNTVILKNTKLMYEFEEFIKLKPDTIVEITDIEGTVYESTAYSVKVTSTLLLGFKYKNLYKVIPLSLIKEINYICENYQPF